MTDNIIYSLEELKGEPGVNKSIKSYIDKIISHLQGDPELGKDKALEEIEEMVAGNNLDPHIRSEIWNVMSMIESL
jgi:uncharacterized protein (UPF0147 family)